MKWMSKHKDIKLLLICGTYSLDSCVRIFSNGNSQSLSLSALREAHETISLSHECEHAKTVGRDYYWDTVRL